MHRVTGNIGCAGILVEDTFCGPMDRLPAGGELLPLAGMPVHVGGCAANVGLGLIKQGHRVGLSGCLGEDASADTILALLGQAGADVAQVVKTPGHPTSKTVILLVKNEDRRYLHVFGANQAFTSARLPAAWLDTLDVLYVGGLFALPGLDLAGLADALAHCRAAGIATVLDVVVPPTGPRLEQFASLLPHVDYFLPNTDEARVFTGLDDPVQQARALQKAGARTVVVTLGADGAVALRGDQGWRCGAYADDGIDPSGAGDAFAAGLIHAHLQKWDLPRALHYASAIGQSATRALGTTAGIFTADEADHFVSRHHLPVTEIKITAQ
ncbi:MAG: carbohydrate kinase family protein [Opitutaceae bacterium]|nr:carbohydrate kinase family protein [Cephaloticoccus sp.]MCP5529317.1 carbohydrate kinase family protein [Opitutaceae bacterium]